MEESIRILIADDHEVVRDGLRLILEAEDGFVVVGQAGDGEQAVEMAGKLLPDVVLMDLRMPGMDGIEALEHIQSLWPEISIVILTTYDENDLMQRGLRAGALGYLLKDTTRESLINTLRAAAQGEALLDPAVLKRVLSAKPGETKKFDSRPGIQLTDREYQVLDRVAKGERSKEIAFGLGITERTVKSHLSKIYQKLGVDSRAAAVAEAAKRGLLDMGND